jgi:hypothetical protein
MPTAFTDYIENGELTKFSDFAKLCTRAFDAAIHMRDEGLDTPYIKREVDLYYKERVSDIENEIKILKDNPSEVYESYKKALSEDINLYKDEIKQRNSRKEIVASLIKEANEWLPPTKEHENFKNFVLEQLKYAEQDVDTFYYETTIIDWQRELDTATLENFVEGRTSELNEKWVEELFKSLK